jgi:hypothetical protein
VKDCRFAAQVTPPTKNARADIVPPARDIAGAAAVLHRNPSVP